MNLNQKGFVKLVIYVLAAILVFGGLITYLFWFDKGTRAPGPKINPSPTLSGEVKKDLEEAKSKQKQFEENKTDIKTKLNLTEEQYQLLKQYSSN